MSLYLISVIDIYAKQRTNIAVKNKYYEHTTYDKYS